MRYAPAVFSLVCFLSAPKAIGQAHAADVIVYETHDADADNDLPCYRLTLGPMIDAEAGIEMDGVYGGEGFILRARNGDDCTHFRGEAAYDENHSYFIDLLMDPTCSVPKRFVAELKGRHDPKGQGYGTASCKKLRRSRDRHWAANASLP